MKKAIQLLSDDPKTRTVSSKLKGLVRIIEEIDSDLEISGECIIELDMDRLDAIEERNKFIKFIDQIDDV